MIFHSFIVSFLYSIRAQAFSVATRKATETKKRVVESNNNERKNTDDQLDESAYKRASVNDFFSKAFGPSQSELKPDQPHSVRSAFESFAGDFIQRPPPGTKRETLATVKEEMRKKKLRIETKN